MLEQLHVRLRNSEDYTDMRRPSMWHASTSASSVHSSGDGSLGYHSPQSLPPGPAAYRQPSITAHSMTSYGDSGSSARAQTPPYHHQQTAFQANPVQPWEPTPPVSQYFEQSSGQQFSFGQQTLPHTHPSLQFASWGGYGGPSMPDTLDEENAVPPNTDPWSFG